MSDVFISYGRKDRPLTQLIADRFRNQGLTVWYDEHIPGGDDWYKDLINQLRRTQSILLILTPNSIDSPFVHIECGAAIALGKKVIPIMVDQVTVPSYISHLHILPYMGVDTIDQITDQIKNLEGRFWGQLFKRGLDLCVAIKPYEDTEAVSRRTLTATLDFYHRLCERYSPHLQNPNALKILPVRTRGMDLNPERNWILMGGPGGFPYVADLLDDWHGHRDVLFNGYRFVTEPTRFKTGLHLRDSDQRDETGKWIIGVEDMNNGQAQAIHKVVDSSLKTDGRNYGIIYTKGFNQPDRQKIIVLSPFNRYVLDGMVNFILNTREREKWLNKLLLCGEHSETLFHFSVNQGEPTSFEGYDRPRQFANNR
jgi:hypothetical protein